MKMIEPSVAELPKKQNIKLTKLKVEGLPIPTEGQSLHWDSELRGLALAEFHSRVGERQTPGHRSEESVEVETRHVHP